MFSTSMIENNNLFKDRPVKWIIKANKNSSFFANGFLLESEALISDGSKLKLLNIDQVDGKIVIEAELL